MEDVVRELYASARKNFPRRSTVLKGLFDLHQADLAEFLPYAKQNKGYKYILFIIDCFSKRLWCEPLKSKNAVDMLQAFENIYGEEGKKGCATIRAPTHLQTDLGTEFYNSRTSAYLKRLNIKHYSTYSVKKAAIVERVIRTIKNKIYKVFALRGKYVWYDKLQEVVDDYNNTVHSTIKMKPIQVTTREHELRLLNTVYNHVKTAGRGKFKVGDVVRISKHKTVFEKGYTPSWTTELFKIVKVKLTEPVTYLLEDMSSQPIRGGFYAFELQRAKHDDVYLVEKILKRKNDKVFVKWLGFDRSHNSWIDKTNMML